MNILAIGAHPDDVENSCGGTLAKYAKMGHKVFTATATNGNIGSATLPMEEIAAIRKEEARRAAAIIGAEYICLDYDDEMFFEDKAARLAFIDLVRYCRADVILTHNPEDYNPDHELTSKIVNDIAVMIPIAKIKTKNKPYDKIPIIAYFEPVNGLGFVPTEYVDITDTFETMLFFTSSRLVPGSTMRPWGSLLSMMMLYSSLPSVPSTFLMVFFNRSR